MSAQEGEAPDAENAEEEREEFAWLNQTPTTTISGKPLGMIYAGSLSQHEEQNGTSFGIVLEDVEVVEGDLYRNADKPEDGFTFKDDENEQRATDYRVVDLDDQQTTTVNAGDQTFVTDRSGASFEPADGFDEGPVIAWYNGMAGQFVARALDFNGRPFAEYKEDGYLMKGLFQVAEGWRDRSQRSDLAKNGKAPRVARVPILRPEADGERVTIEIGRYNGGRMYEAHVYEGATTDEDAEFDMRYEEEADDVLAEEGVTMSLHHGEGWQDRPANAEASADDFDIQVEAGGGVEDTDGLTSQQEAFVESTSNALEGTDLTPAEAFNGGLSGLMENHGVSGDVEEIREAIYVNVSHLDEEDL